MVGSVVGPMPAKEFLELLPPTSLSMPSESVEGEHFTNLAKFKTESKPQMYDPFVRILFILLCPWTGVKYSLDQGDEIFLPQPSIGGIDAF